MMREKKRQVVCSIVSHVHAQAEHMTRYTLHRYSYKCYLPSRSITMDGPCFKSSGMRWGSVGDFHAHHSWRRTDGGRRRRTLKEEEERKSAFSTPPQKFRFLLHLVCFFYLSCYSFHLCNAVVNFSRLSAYRSVFYWTHFTYKYIPCINSFDCSAIYVLITKGIFSGDLN